MHAERLVPRKAGTLSYERHNHMARSEQASGIKCQGSQVWWLILCVSLARSWDPDIWSNTILDISVKVIFKIRLTHKSVNFGVKQVILHSVENWVGFIQSIEDLSSKRVRDAKNKQFWQ